MRVTCGCIWGADAWFLVSVVFANACYLLGNYFNCRLITLALSASIFVFHTHRDKGRSREGGKEGGEGERDGGRVGDRERISAKISTS